MYQVGDQVVYGIHGVCRVIDTEKQIVTDASGDGSAASIPGNPHGWLDWE